MPLTVRFHSIGGPEVLRLDEVAVPLPQENEVRIQTRALGLNRADVKFRTGNYGIRPEFPQTLDHRAVAFIKQGLGTGILAPKVDTVFELADIADAYRYLESNTQVVKVVVSVPAPDVVS